MGQQKEGVTVLGATKGAQKIKDICYYSRHPQVAYSKGARGVTTVGISEGCHRGPHTYLQAPGLWGWSSRALNWKDVNNLSSCNPRITQAQLLQCSAIKRSAWSTQLHTNYTKNNWSLRIQEELLNVVESQWSFHGGSVELSLVHALTPQWDSVWRLGLWEVLWVKRSQERALLMGLVPL